MNLVLFGIILLAVFGGFFVYDAFAQTTPRIILDQPAYTWTERIFITVEASEFAGSNNISVSVSTREYILDDYTLTEEKSGVFKGEVTLTGFEHDAYGDGTVATQPRTLGNGPTNGFLQAQRDDAVTVSLEYGDSSIIESSIITWNLGVFLSDVSECIPDSDVDCIATVKDPDMNLYPDRLDHLYEVLMYSETDPVGIDVVMVETGDDTGIFQWHYTTTLTDTTSGNRLQISPGDNVVIKYVDNTPPKPFSEDRPTEIVQSNIPVPIPQSPPDFTVFDEYRGKEVNKNGVTIIFPEDLDVYFPTVQGIYDRLQENNIIPADRHSLEKHVDENNDEIIITEKLVVETENYNEFLKVFEINPTEHTIPLSVNGTLINDRYIDQKIKSHLQLCSSDNQNYIYCRISPEQLKNQILQKTGTHTISESFKVKKISIQEKGNSFGDVEQVSKLMPVVFSKNESNSQDIIYFISTSFDEIKQFKIPLSAHAQPNSNTGMFLNGFTVGYGFEQSWFYEFTVLDMIPISIDAHIENGLGIGLRIPIEVALATESNNTENFEVDYNINTKNLSDDEYQQLLGVGKSFGGNEFKMYLGPKISLDVSVMGDSVYNYSKEAFATPEESDFQPPLNNKETSQKITSYTVPCEIIRTCFELPVGTIGLHVGSTVNVSGEKVSLTSSPFNSDYGSHPHEFKYNNHSQNYNYDTLDPTSLYGTTVSDLKYHSDLHVIPQAMIDADILFSWIFPFDLSTGWIDFPQILFEDIVFEKHENTVGVLKISSDTEPNCGEGMRYVDGICIEEEDPVENPGNNESINNPPSNGGGSDNGCLIATAAYGSELAPQVQFLREVRDHTLYSTESGSSFMTGFNEFYYSFSPTIADWERQSPVFKESVKLFITPMISSLSIMTLAEQGSEIEVLGLGISVIMLNLGMYIAMPALVIYQIKRNWH